MAVSKKGFKIEQEVTYIAPDAQFVSLVKYAANRQPFTILKSQKGESNMGKKMVSILIPNTVSKEETEGYLKEYNNADPEKFDTYTKYRQVDSSAIKTGTEEMIYIDTEKKVMGVVAELKEDSNDDPDANKDTSKKESVDYATMVTVFDEAYSMLDIVAGAMGQSGMDNESRKSLISSAIDNFGSFVDQFFGENSNKSMKDGLDIKTVKGLIYPLRKDDSGDDGSGNAPADTPPALTEARVAELISEALAETTKTLTELSASLKESQTEKAAEKTKFAEFTTSLKNANAKMAELEESFDNLKAQPRTHKSAVSPHDDTPAKGDTEDDGVFKGTVFTSIS